MMKRISNPLAAGLLGALATLGTGVAQATENLPGGPAVMQMNLTLSLIHI